ncbi:MAG TPA: hypothetical protein VLT91_10090 [Rhizomicrobium sp.]|nr:hypothetical protein [Rhizomicrobium sp.]
MQKIPVFGTIAHAYGFAVTQFFRILGITWAPLAVSIAVSLMLTPGFAGNHMPLNDQDEIARQTLRLLPLSFLVLLVIRSMVAVGVTELALGLRKGPTFVYFSIGAPVWRLFGAWLLFLLVMILIYIGLIILVIVLAVVGGIAIKAAALSHGADMIAIAGLAALCALLFLGALVYVLARLTFLIPPVIVAEKKIDLARGWELTRGNFWRILAIGITLFIPVIVAGCAVFLAVYGTGMIHTMTEIFVLAGRGASEAVMQQHIDAMSEAMRAKGLALWPVTAAANLLVETFLFGLLYGASAFAYRALTPGPAAPSLRDPR